MTLVKCFLKMVFFQIVSPVVGGLVVGLPVFNLSDPVFVLLWSSEDLDSLAHGAGELIYFYQTNLISWCTQGLNLPILIQFKNSEMYGKSLAGSQGCSLRVWLTE
jgi:hypothetical protein